MKSQNEKVNSSKILANCQLECSKRTVQRLLKLQEMKYKIIAGNIKLSVIDKEKRLAMAKEWISNNIQWELAVFVNEKVFFLDGPAH